MRWGLPVSSFSMLTRDGDNELAQIATSFISVSPWDCKESSDKSNAPAEFSRKKKVDADPLRSQSIVPEQNWPVRKLSLRHHRIGRLDSPGTPFSGGWRVPCW